MMSLILSARSLDNLKTSSVSVTTGIGHLVNVLLLVLGPRQALIALLGQCKEVEKRHYKLPHAK